MMKTMFVEGMMCVRCKARVEKALNAIEGVKAEANVGTKTVDITMTQTIDDKTLVKAVTDAGYTVKSLV